MTDGGFLVWLWSDYQNAYSFETTPSTQYLPDMSTTFESTSNALIDAGDALQMRARAGPNPTTLALSIPCGSRMNASVIV